MDASVFALGAAANGDVIAGGVFQTAGGVMSPFAARLATTCPATASTIPTACTASAGPLLLRDGSLPWIGSTCRTSGSGAGANALVAAVEGFTSPAIPLSAIHPGGLPNCFLLASTDSVRLLLPVGGQVSSAIAIPRNPALAGMPVYQQLLQLEGLGGPIALSSSNALLLTVGVF
jgi:hypothetical protein